MKDFFIKWYAYNGWANRRVVECLQRQNVIDEKILSVFGHLMAANFIWLNRIKDLPKSEYELWGKYSLSDLELMVDQADKQWTAFIQANENFDRVLKYKNYVGQYFENNVLAIMTHLVNHGTYHRGQVAMLLRQQGFEPINTDFITYDRVISGQL
jgi:uncharacterized damage-inducible protein DinB